MHSLMLVMEKSNDFDDSYVNSQNLDKWKIHENNSNANSVNSENFVKIYDSSSNGINIPNFVPGINQRLTVNPRYYPKNNSVSFCLRNMSEYSRHLKSEFLEKKNLKNEFEDFNKYTLNMFNQNIINNTQDYNNYYS